MFDEQALEKEALKLIQICNMLERDHTLQRELASKGFHDDDIHAFKELAGKLIIALSKLHRKYNS